MKNYLNFILILSLCLGYSSCKKEKMNPLIGSWQLITYTEFDCDDPIDDYVEDYTLLACDIDPDECYEISYEFIDDSSAKARYLLISYGDTESEEIEFTYTLDDSKLTLCTDTDGCESYTVSFSGNTMTLDVTELTLGDNCMSSITFRKE